LLCLPSAMTIYDRVFRLHYVFSLKPSSCGTIMRPTPFYYQANSSNNLPHIFALHNNSFYQILGGRRYGRGNLKSSLPKLLRAGVRLATEARKRGYDDRMDCMREDISVSKGNLAECEARVSSFERLERGSPANAGEP
jgi:hypothetical protein